jgi:hypothetical protein
MKNLRWLLTNAVLVGMGLAPAAVLAQETSLSGFLHRAGAAVTRTATAATHPTASPQQVGPAGTVTTGPYFRPISPAHGGRFEGLFANFRPGLNSFPRAALTFTHFGSVLPCWTVSARIWQSATKHEDEVFEICNSPIEARDAVGNVATVNVGQGLQLANFLLPAQNLEGATHAPTSTARNNGVNPPLMFFNVPFTGPTAYAMSTQYRQMLLRLSWVSDVVDPASPDVNSTVGKVMWTAGFDPNGNADKAAL